MAHLIDSPEYHIGVCEECGYLKAMIMKPEAKQRALADLIRIGWDLYPGKQLRFFGLHVGPMGSEMCDEEVSEVSYRDWRSLTRAVYSQKGE